MNKGTIAGHLAADPETRYTGDGKKVTNLRIGCNSRKGKQDETIWWRATIWGDRFDALIPHLKKGSGLFIFGDIRKPEIYTGKDGRPQVSLEITAESISFSPFGKPGAGSGDGQARGASGFGEQTFDEGSFGTTSGKASSMMLEEEETVPF